MYCPSCGHIETRVIDSRLLNDGQGTRRRRVCPACGERFTTLEQAQWAYPRVIKRDGRREPFEEQKIRSGLLRALEKRPVPTETLESLIQDLLRRVRTSGESEIAARQIGEWVMEKLRDLDPVAYVRFASVYRDFNDVHDFRRAIDRLSEPSVHHGDRKSRGPRSS
jgi:transcriptional repressor NrdR